jgi:hypothetical protein
MRHRSSSETSAQPSPERAHTHEVTNPALRRQQLCTCSHCGVTARCTPYFDFYTLGAGGVGCAYVEWGKR